MGSQDALYLEVVVELQKATGLETPRSYIRSVNAIHAKYEPKVLAVVQKALRAARNRFVQKFNVTDIAELFESLRKADSDDVKAEIRKILESSLNVQFTEAVVSELQPMIDDLAKEFKSVQDVDLNFERVNETATSYLKEKVQNNFSTLADDQAKGIYSTISDAMSSSDGYTLSDIVQGIKDKFGSDTLYFPTEDGTREVDATTWATTVARTETARAASYATKAMANDLGLKTWEWHAQGSCCDDCDLNDGETVTVGEDFPSGDTEAPGHPNCRCICTLNQAELTSLGGDEEEDSGD